MQSVAWSIYLSSQNQPEKDRFCLLSPLPDPLDPNPCYFIGVVRIQMRPNSQMILPFPSVPTPYYLSPKLNPGGRGVELLLTASSMVHPAFFFSELVLPEFSNYHSAVFSWTLTWFLSLKFLTQRDDGSLPISFPIYFANFTNHSSIQITSGRNF